MASIRTLSRLHPQLQMSLRESISRTQGAWNVNPDLFMSTIKVKCTVSYPSCCRINLTHGHVIFKRYSSYYWRSSFDNNSGRWKTATGIQQPVARTESRAMMAIYTMYLQIVILVLVTSIASKEIGTGGQVNHPTWNHNYYSPILNCWFNPGIVGAWRHPAAPRIHHQRPEEEPGRNEQNCQPNRRQAQHLPRNSL